MGGDGIIGFKITRYTEKGAAALAQLLSSIIDALFAEPGVSRGPADALARAFLEHLHIKSFLSEAA